MICFNYVIFLYLCSNDNHELTKRTRFGLLRPLKAQQAQHGWNVELCTHFTERTRSVSNPGYVVSNIYGFNTRALHLQQQMGRRCVVEKVWGAVCVKTIFPRAKSIFRRMVVIVATIRFRVDDFCSV